MAPVLKGWPPHLTYLTSPGRSKFLTKDQQAIARTKQDDLPVIPPEASQTPYPNVKITLISDPSHPARGQSGLFATKHLKPGSFILLYLGNVHPESDVEAKKSDYDLWLDRDAGIAVDAARCGNEARFVNDYRGVRDRPNAEFREVWSVRHQERCMAVFVLPERKKTARKTMG
jgi:hypothetical protein